MISNGLALLYSSCICKLKTNGLQGIVGNCYGHSQVGRASIYTGYKEKMATKQP